MSVAVLLPAYKRPEYTKLCLEALEKAQEYSDVRFFLYDDCSKDGTSDLFNKSSLEKVVTVNEEQWGLRNIIIDFFDRTKSYDYLAKVDNDCLVPQNWLNDLLSIIKEAKADIISPNTSETSAAHKYGDPSRREGAFIPSKIVGGLWFMRRAAVEDIYFEKCGTTGIRGAFHIINQIVTEHEPKIGWTDRVTFDDVGYLSGSHPEHIKSEDHLLYSHEVGRKVTWRPSIRNTHDTSTKSFTEVSSDT